MRLIHLSDVHLSSDGIEDLKNYFLQSLIADLSRFEKDKKIDVIIITGDLLDKGGSSFAENNGYSIFESAFLNPLMDAFSLTSKNILFVPGNHDIDRKVIDRHVEYSLSRQLNGKMANDIVKQTMEEFTNENQRIHGFKLFEKKFHKDDHNYFYSNNNSVCIYERANEKIGFALINDSWRCSNGLESDRHFWGTRQLWNSINIFKENKTNFNIAVFHHPFSLINEKESDEATNIIKTEDIQLAIFGHTHKSKFGDLFFSTGNYKSLVGRALFNDSSEEGKYQPGYAIIDIDVPENNYTIQARKFIRDGFRFDKDVDAFPDGIRSGIFDAKLNIELSNDTKAPELDLPNGFGADVGKIVSLLIGKSLYPSPYAFVRELIQNSVDACDRKMQQNTFLSPKIKIIVNTPENYFEVTDEGDGMSRRILREHFSKIGRSISEEVNDHTGTSNLISQFGIGFISVFIVAETVFISTKAEGESRVRFKITNVFQSFQYLERPIDGISENDETGTTIKVYLKRGIVGGIEQQILSFCRHISNLSVIIDSRPLSLGTSWNTEQGIFDYADKTPEFELRLAAGTNGQRIIASNRGFLISDSPNPIIPFRFPHIIFGEINFSPRAIDFDLSRTNIIPSEKSANAKRVIALSLKALFTKIIEAQNISLLQEVLSCLQFYLCTIEQNKLLYEESYYNFYTKTELIELCASLMKVESDLGPVSLKDAINKALQSSDKNIYIFQPNSKLEYEAPIAQYFSSLGKVVCVQHPFVATFKEGGLGLNTFQVIQLIAQFYQMPVIKIGDSPSLLTSLVVPYEQLGSKIADAIAKIKNRYGINVEAIRLTNFRRPTIRTSDKFYFNIGHETIVALLTRQSDMPDDLLQFYLIGFFHLTPPELVIK